MFLEMKRFISSCPPSNSGICSAKVTISGPVSPVTPSPSLKSDSSTPFGSPSSVLTPASTTFSSSWVGGGSSGTSSSGLISGGVNFTVDFNGGGGSAGGGGGCSLSIGGGS